jgi:alpha-tubulin suppressor-like RCC1 family protein/outer membrane protein OmpA-like peptidoglycan-associated protein
MFSHPRRKMAVPFFLLISAIVAISPLSPAPVQASIVIQDPSTPSKITGGDGFLCLIVNGGAVECSGLNDQGQLGDGTNTNRSYSRPITSDGKISSPTALAVGKSHACAVSGGGSSAPGSGKLYCWGDNQYGQLGNGTNVDSSLPVLVSDNGAFVNTSVAGVFAGDNHTCAITLAPTNRIFCWGYNNKGQLGDNTTVDKNLPAAVLGVFTSTGTEGSANFYPWATAGAEHTCAVSTANTNKIYCWGENGSGQLGDGSTTDSLLPVATVMTGGSGSSTRTAFIAAGSDFTCATDAGSIKCWGENGSGQMGNGGTTDVLTPTAIPSFGGFTNAVVYSMAAGGGTVCVISEAAATPELFCWGANAARQVGNNATVDANRPTSVTDNSAQEFDNGGGSATNANGLTVGRSAANGFACITRWCWGSNNTGQLAQNNTTDVTLASKIKTGVTVADDVTGLTVSAVLKSTGMEIKFTGVPAAGLSFLSIVIAPATHVLAPNQTGGAGTTGYGPQIYSGGTLPTVSGGQITVLVPAMSSGVNSVSGPPTYASTPFVKGVSYHLTYSGTGTATSGYPDGWRIRNGVTTGTELVATIDSSFAADAASGSSSSTTTTPATSTTVAPGAAATTGSAAGVGNYATAVPGVTVTDAKVYVTAPREVAGASAITVLTSAQNKVMDVVSKTPSICLPNDDDLIFLDEGKCIADVVNVKTRKVLRTLRTTVVEDDIADLKVGNEIAILTPLYFFSGTTNFKDASLARLGKLKSRINAAGSVLIAGHSGTLTGNTPENVKLSQQRAAATVKELKLRGAKGPFAIATVGALDPASKGKSQADQDKNRRVVIVLIP